MSPQIEIMSLYSLRVFFADNVTGSGQQSTVHRPRIGHVENNIKPTQQSKKTPQRQSITGAEYMGEDALSYTVVSIKQPSLIAFTAYI